MALATLSQRLHTVLISIFLGVATAHIEQYVEVPQCRPNTSQQCPQEPEVMFTAGHNEGFDARFTANANHCSDILVRFLVDHYPQGNFMRVGPSQTVSGAS
jgi:hypothetical protein